LLDSLLQEIAAAVSYREKLLEGCQTCHFCSAKRKPKVKDTEVTKYLKPKKGLKHQVEGGWQQHE